MVGHGWTHPGKPSEQTKGHRAASPPRSSAIAVGQSFGMRGCAAERRAGGAAATAAGGWQTIRAAAARAASEPRPGRPRATGTMPLAAGMAAPLAAAG
jgi:hypothetical protein